MTSKQDFSNTKQLFLNASIGFLGVLLSILIIGLIIRIIFPKIETTRVQVDAELVTDIIQIEVLNGCGIPGIATRYTETIREYGFDVVETGNFDTFDVVNSFIISRGGTIDNAKRVANALGIPENQILIETSPDFYLDVTLVIGSDFENLNF